MFAEPQGPDTDFPHSDIPFPTFTYGPHVGHASLFWVNVILFSPISAFRAVSVTASFVHLPA